MNAAADPLSVTTIRPRQAGSIDDGDDGHHARAWFRRSSWLWFHRHQRLVAIMRDPAVSARHGGEPVYKGWRHAWFGPALRLQFPGDDRPTDGWDPATVVHFDEVPG